MDELNQSKAATFVESLVQQLREIDAAVLATLTPPALGAEAVLRETLLDYLRKPLGEYLPGISQFVCDWTEERADELERSRLSFDCNLNAMVYMTENLLEILSAERKADRQYLNGLVRILDSNDAQWFMRQDTALVLDWPTAISIEE